MKLPLLISLPHAGLQIPPEVEDICILTDKDLLASSDGTAKEIYSGLAEHCHSFCYSDIARSIVDLNRAPDDIGFNGVIKNHTCWNTRVYRKFPEERLIRILLAKYYFPYHAELSAGGADSAVRLGLDCHTMSHIGPPVGPDPGQKRPLICVSNADGTCSQTWIMSLAEKLAEAFKERVSLNSPFRGGYISCYHATEMPWIQIEISQTGKYPVTYKKNCLLEALRSFCHIMFKE